MLCVFLRFIIQQNRRDIRVKTYLIDGNNVMHRLPSSKAKLKSDYSNACLALINSVKNYASRYSSYKFIIFFDGFTESVVANHPAIKLEWSFSKTADELIKSHISHHYERSNFTLVSSDTELHNFSRLHSLEIISSDEFIKLFDVSNIANNNCSKVSTTKNKKGEKPNSAGRKEVSLMMKLFAEADNK